jgi:hypothetical protein
LVLTTKRKKEAKTNWHSQLVANSKKVNEKKLYKKDEEQRPE